MDPKRSNRATLQRRKAAEVKKGSEEHVIYHQPLIGAINPLGLAGNSLKQTRHGEPLHQSAVSVRCGSPHLPGFGKSACCTVAQTEHHGEEGVEILLLL